VGVGRCRSVGIGWEGEADDASRGVALGREVFVKGVDW
jgi:hypothetical protein